MTALELLLDELGVSYRQLDYWVRKGWLRPRWDRRRPAGGTGALRDFEGTEHAVANRMARLVNRGFKPEAAARIGRALVEADSDHVYLGAGIHLLVARGDTVNLAGAA